MLYYRYMDDILPLFLSVLAFISLFLFGLILYALTILLGFDIAIFLTVGVFSLLAATIMFLLAPNIDNKDIIKVSQQIIFFVIIANVLVVLANLVKIVALKS